MQTKKQIEQFVSDANHAVELQEKMANLSSEVLSSLDVETSNEVFIRLERNGQTILDTLYSFIEDRYEEDALFDGWSRDDFTDKHSWLTESGTQMEFKPWNGWMYFPETGSGKELEKYGVVDRAKFLTYLIDWFGLDWFVENRPFQYQ